MQKYVSSDPIVWGIGYALIGALFSIAGFWVVKWIKGIDSRLDNMEKKFDKVFAWLEQLPRKDEMERLDKRTEEFVTKELCEERSQRVIASVEDK